ncbi:hypothetical protein C8Q77DRAFT_1156110 [Trametes polyzona]|nr:hypothetical protein C8Q77DRAFT_1156110 [Trametes polyzona]
MSRGLSVHVFKNALTTSQPAQPLPPAPAKYDPAQARVPSNGGGLWNRQQSYQAPHNEPERKQPPLPLSQDRRLVHVQQPASQPWPVDTKHSKLKGYLIHPSPGNDMYIYERSIISTDDGLSSSPSSDSSSDSELFPETELALARLEISSTRASSSTETLESTLYGTNLAGRGAITAGGGAVHSLARPPLAITAPPLPPPPPTRSSSTRDNAAPARPGIPQGLARTESYRTRTTSISHAVHPIQFSNLDSLSDSDSDTLFSENPADNMVVDMLGASQWAMSSSIAHSAARSATPFRRDSSDQQRVIPPPSGTRTRRESIDRAASRGVPIQLARTDRDDPPHPRAPPGLYGAVATPPDATQHPGPAGQSPPRAATLASSPPAPSAPRAQPPPPPPAQTQMPTSSSGSPTQLARTASMRPHEAPVRSQTAPAAVPAPSPPSSSSPQRRNSQPAPGQGGLTQTDGVVVVSAAKRTVRWTENLVCPSPVPFEQRRKGWFNRRGDQLWTNDGQFKSPDPGQEYPPDLAHYPEPNVGWMNEEGVRIDMQHRLVPKRPLRSALKQSKGTV